MRSRGFTLIEVLVALLILSLVITTSLAVYYDRQRRLLAAKQMMIAYEALANEGEIWRHTKYADLPPGTTSAFLSDPALTAELGDAAPLVIVRQPAPDYKTVDLTITWGGKLHSASLELVRCETGQMW